MKIDRDVVAHIEALARLELSPGEVEQITEQFGRIVEFVERLQAVDTSGVEPTRIISHGKKDHVRSDEVRPCLDREVVLGQAPDRYGDFFRVPRVIDRGEE